jgi:SNF2 family DNA or RNA helicase
MLKIKNIQLSVPQKEAIEFLLNRNYGLVSYGTGKGKTVIQLAVAFYLLNNGSADKFILNVTKSSIIEICNDLDSKTNILKYKILNSFEDLHEFIYSDFQIGVIQYENMRKILCDTINRKLFLSLKKAQEVVNLLMVEKVGFCFDEFHILKNTDSIFRKSYNVIRSNMSHCYGFTATPLMSSLTDLFNLITFLDKTFYNSNIERFLRVFTNRTKKIVSRNKQVLQIVGFKNLEQLEKELGNYLISNYSFPQDLQFEKIETELSNDREYYKVLEDLIDGDDFKSSEKRVQLQLCVNNDPLKKNILLSTIKENLDKGSIVYCSYHETVKIVKDLLLDNKIEFCEINGHMSTEQRLENKMNFINRPVGKVLIITQAGGQSLNLQCTNVIIFYDTEQSPGKFMQIMGRIVREFSSFDTFNVKFIVAKETIDDYKYAYLNMHKEVVFKILSNELIPDGVFSSFDGFLLKNLRNSLMWKTRGKNGEKKR